MIRNIIYDEVIGINKKRIFSIIGLISKSTDFAHDRGYVKDEYVLSGSVVPKDTKSSYYDFDNLLREMKATIINHKGQKDYRNIHNPSVGIRLSGNYSDIKEQAKVVEVLGDGIKVVEYGEYPTDITFEIQGQKTYSLDKEKMLLETGKTYWIPNLEIQTYLNPHLESHVRCYLGENRPEDYIEIKEYVDSNGNKYAEHKGRYYVVQPLRWYVDEKEDYAVCMNTIAGGLPYGSYFQMLYPELEDTYSVDYFVSNKLVQDLIPSEIYELPEEYIPESVVKEPIATVSLPNLDNLNREQLEALQAQIAQILAQKNNNQNRSLVLKP